MHRFGLSLPNQNRHISRNQNSRNSYVNCWATSIPSESTYQSGRSKRKTTEEDHTQAKQKGRETKQKAKQTINQCLMRRYIIGTELYSDSREREAEHTKRSKEEAKRHRKQDKERHQRNKATRTKQAPCETNLYNKIARQHQCRSRRKPKPKPNATNLLNWPWSCQVNINKEENKQINEVN